ncbi:MAG: cupin domain-containing protein [Phycisphaerales bacterium]|nr:cupin domain-containing protein [Phycisphaerales bacterium]
MPFNHRPAYGAIVVSAVLAGCASDNRTRQGGAAPITHEPYGTEMQPFETNPPADIVWKPGPPSLAAGAQMTVLEGDPTKEGPFVFRVKVPDGFLIKPHTHPRAERVTVIQGTFNIAMHGTVEEAQRPGNLKSMPAGSFGYWPARMPHVAWTSGGGETIAQFHGYGPWIIEYLNPADDPRNATKP